MAESKIEWTDATWNPTVGCSRVSEGCDNCYAIGVAHRAMQPAHAGLTIRRPGERLDWTGEVRALADRLDTPIGWESPRRIFVDSMSDLFHRQVPVEFTAQAWATMAITPQHTYQILTKRPHRAERILNGSWHLDVEAQLTAAAGPIDWRSEEYPTSYSPRWLPNVWIGTSVELDRWTTRIAHLQATPAAVRFLSLEPLLGPLPSLDLTGIGWVIVGGESGPGARPMHPDWVRDIRDRCVAAGVPFFFKQWGTWAPLLPYLQAGGACPVKIVELPTDGGGRRGEMVKLDKGRSGRELDGRTWDEMPTVAA